MSPRPEPVGPTPPGDGDEERRHRAVLQVDPAALGSVALLVRFLEDPSWRVRAAAAELLAKADPRQAVPALVAALRDADPSSRAAAAEALGKLGGAQAVAALMAVLDAGDTPLVHAALEGLRRLRAPPEAKRLEALAHDARLRRAALRLAAESDDVVALELVARGLEDASRAVREAALSAVGRVRLRRSARLRTLGAAVVRAAARSHDLARWAGSALSGDDVELCCGALSVLEWVGQPRDAVAIARAAADGEEPLRTLAVEALTRLCASGGDALLDTLLRHADPGVARSAASAFAELSRRGAAPTREEARPSMAQEDFLRLRDLVHDHSGLTFGEDARLLFENRLAPRLALVDVPDFASYHRFLATAGGGRDELEAAVEALTVNETYLFREPHQLRAFSEELLPALAGENGGVRRLRIWSAGCSTGEEVYTIAILLARSRLFEGWDVEVLGSDVARRALAIAEAGAYGPHAFRSPEAEALRPWFRPEGGKWHVRDAIRSMVRFVQMNLLEDRATRLAPSVDVIFCRNVMIYFDLAARRRLAGTFLDKLREGGYLLLGHAESLLHVTADFELVQLRHDLAYRKPRR